MALKEHWTAFANPATLVQSSVLQIACQYDNRYIISQLSTEQIQAAWCNRFVNVGVSYMHFGYKHYGEHMAGITFAHDFGGRFTLGLQGTFYAAYMGEELRFKSTFLPQIGMTVNATPRITIGVHVFNPFQQRLRGDMVDKPLPSVYQVGMHWHIGQDFHWLMQLEQEVHSQLRVATGGEWQAVKQLRVRLGAAWHDYFIGFVGARLTLATLDVDTNVEVHPILGLCVQARLSWHL